MANTDTHEEFWGITLTKENKSFTWDPASDTSEEDVEHKVQLTQACLGHKAKQGERNLVEVTTENDEGKKITIPIVALSVGGKECVHLELGFNNATKFVLKEGTGPVGLCGVHLQALPLDLDDEDSSDESEDEEVPDLLPIVADEGVVIEEIMEEPKIVEIKDDAKVEAKKADPVTEKPKVKETKVVEKAVEGKKEDCCIINRCKENKKRPAVEEKETCPAKKKKDVLVEKPKVEKKVPQTEKEEAESDDDDEDDDDEDGDDDEEMVGADDADSDEEDDDEEDLDDLDTDEMDSDEDDDDSDEEESEEEAPKKSVNKKVANTKAKPPAKDATKQNSVKTPKGKENMENGIKTPKGKKGTPAAAKKTPEELKAFLLKSPNLPKTYEKFTNLMKNNMKVTDDKQTQELWDFVKKNKK